jgi:thiosulfate reductase / polysulfide reductase chain A
MKRRQFVQATPVTLATVALGQTIVMTPDAEAGILDFLRGTPKLYGQRKDVRRASGKGRKHNDYSKATIVKSVCLNCSTVCGIQGYVIDGKLVKIGGNPEDPNNGKSLCAKGQSGPTISTYADRIVYPMKRVGARGEGKWQRISWDEAYGMIVPRIRKAMDEGKPEEVAIQIGRSRIGEEMTRFLNAIGSPSLFNHRALCSSNKRAANYVSLGETDWETGDFERAKYILNFGSNFYEAHQGAIHTAKRIIRGRFDNGAKLVTLDVRMSNTAGRSDEWLCPRPGTGHGPCHHRSGQAQCTVAGHLEQCERQRSDRLDCALHAGMGCRAVRHRRRRHSPRRPGVCRCRTACHCLYQPGLGRALQRL